MHFKNDHFLTFTVTE